MRQVILIAAIALASWAGKLHGAELFRAIDESEAASVAAAEDDFIAEATWSARRYRVVLANSELLEHGVEFTINWFDDAPMSVKTRNVTRDDFTVHWEGRGCRPQQARGAELHD